MSHNIRCAVRHGPVTMWKIDDYQRVWPCAMFSNKWAERLANNEERDFDIINTDKYTEYVFNEDFNWNNLENHTFDEIINHHFYRYKISDDGWESDPHPLCKVNCEVSYDSILNVEASASSIITVPERELRKDKK